jgi:biopolymer transport protein ExbD
MQSGKRRGPLKKMAAHIGPNMTPMVDVVMCILIFFMLGSSFVVPELFLKSNTAAIDKGGLGTEQGNQKLPAAKMNITLRRQGDDTWVSAGDTAPMQMNKIDDTDQANNEAIFARLAERRKNISDDVQVLIVPEGKVPYQDVITVYDFCTKLQFKQVAFYPAK